MRRLSQLHSAGRDPGGWTLGETGDNRLTNAVIESMQMAGLPESTIQMKIEAEALRGLVDLDASSNALIALKQKGATRADPKRRVVWAEPFGALRKRQQEEDRAVPGLPSSAGVYYKGPSEWVRLRSFFLWPPLYSSRNVSFRRSHEYNVPLGGSHADLQIRELQPAFFLREPAAEGWHVRLTSHDDQRLVRLISSGEFAAQFLVCSR